MSTTSQLLLFFLLGSIAANLFIICMYMVKFFGLFKLFADVQIMYTDIQVDLLKEKIKHGDEE